MKNSLFVKALYLLLLVSSFVFTPAFARLGETEDQLVARFGEGSAPKPFHLAHALSGDIKMQDFQKGTFSITVFLINNIDVAEEYQKTGENISNEESKYLLSVNGEGHLWVLESLKSPSTKIWRRSDGALATLCGSALFFQTKQYFDTYNAYQQGDVPSMKGF